MITQNGAAPRVLFVGVKWPPETFLARLIRGLAARGIRVTLTTPKPADDSWRSIPNVEILYIPGWTGSRVERAFRTGTRLAGAATRSLQATAQVLADVKQSARKMSRTELLYRSLPFAGRDWDVIYFPWNATAVTHFALMDRAPAVISCRGTQINVAPHNPRRATLREGLPATFAKAAAVHCVSEAICREATRYGLDRQKSVIIRPAVDPDVFHPAPAPKSQDNGPLRVITTGALIWRKGYEYALAAISLLRDRGMPVHLDIIGTGNEKQRLLYTINDYELAEQVTWHGQLPPAEVLSRLQAADVFLLSSLSEGISNAVLEAMACGLPVVTTDVGGMPEAVTDGVEGLLTPARDPQAIAEALAYLWSRPALRATMGEAGRARVLRDFRLEDQVLSFDSLFRSVA